MALLLARTSLAQHVKTDYDRSVDFGQYKTYYWEKVQTQDPLWVSRIKDAVNASLAARGWTEVASGGQVAILAIEITRDQQTLDTFYGGFGGGWGWRTFGRGGFGIERLDQGERRDELSHWLAHTVRPMFDQRVLPVTEDIIFRWRVLTAEGRKIGHTYWQPDLLIAATALHHGFMVVTRDPDDFDKAGVTVIDPW